MLKNKKGAENSTNDFAKNQDKNSVFEINSLLDIENAIDQLSISDSTQNKVSIDIKNESLLDKLYRSEIDLYKKIENAPSVLSIDNISLGTLGNFSCLNGKSKSRKTFFLTMLISSVLDDNCRFHQRIRSEICGTTILHFDTEQSKYHTQLVGRRVLELLEDKTLTKNYKLYCLRPFSPNERIDLIQEAIYNTKNVKFVIIDGIADLTVGYNNEEEAMKTIAKLMKWTHERNIHIITVIHQNKANDNAKGHLGSFILQKSENVLSVEKTNEISTVQSTHSRGVDINPISFSIDENSLPFFVDYYSNQNSQKSEITNPKNLSEIILKNILNEVYSENKPLSRSEFLISLKRVLSEYEYPNGDNKCKEFLSHFKDLNFVTQEKIYGSYQLNI